ncbi:MAG: divergent PAP2 family protein, partial [Nanoarchaeota archaeon]|nr:divergent PAP2 family protein [Nanoarchaeota archaeon]
HTATVGAMTASIYFSEGFSNLFVVCMIVSMVIISDAVGIRRAAGKQAQVLNSMIEDFTVLRKFKTKRLYELLGHTPKQVIIGLIIGILVAKLVHG